jgi:hypothetical protein
VGLSLVIVGLAQYISGQGGTPQSLGFSLWNFGVTAPVTPPLEIMVLGIVVLIVPMVVLLKVGGEAIDYLWVILVVGILGAGSFLGLRTTGIGAGILLGASGSKAGILLGGILGAVVLLVVVLTALLTTRARQRRQERLRTLALSQANRIGYLYSPKHAYPPTYPYRLSEAQDHSGEAKQQETDERQKM